MDFLVVLSLIIKEETSQEAEREKKKEKRESIYIFTRNVYKYFLIMKKLKLMSKVLFSFCQNNGSHFKT